jgi:hypothetical protein
MELPPADIVSMGSEHVEDPRRGGVCCIEFFNARHQHCALATVLVAPLQRRHCRDGAFPHLCRRALQGKTPATVCNDSVSLVVFVPRIAFP